MFCRFIQSSLTNVMILYNLVHDKKISAKDFVLNVIRAYVQKSKESLANHVRVEIPMVRKVCKLCKDRTSTFCYHCKEHFCIECFRFYHGLHQSIRQQTQQTCKSGNSCKQRTRNYCNECNKYICNKCFDNYYVSSKQN